MKPFGPTYKTVDGARKRAAFERSCNPSEFRNGYVARLYDYSVVEVSPGAYRVARAPKLAPVNA
jgi:hypothetical protein